MNPGYNRFKLYQSISLNDKNPDVLQRYRSLANYRTQYFYCLVTNFNFTFINNNTWQCTIQLQTKTLDIMQKILDMDGNKIPYYKRYNESVQQIGFNQGTQTSENSNSTNILQFLKNKI